ncbi:MAG TPA: CoA ester lyase [Hyphomicrobiales bacterium]|nr:CoA ester lyase [Hyphomicrobiales bacterium]
MITDRKAMRSLLFVPADDPKKLAKATARGTDALILDLEDAVAEAKKDEARAQAAAFLRAHAGRAEGPRLMVRINGFGHPASAADLAAAVAAGADAVMLPKAVGLADVERLAGRLAVAEAEAGRPDGAVMILPLASESGRALLALPTLAGGHPRLMGIAWSGEDLAADLGAVASRRPDGTLPDPQRLARTLALAAAAAAGVPAIDTIFARFQDEDGLRREAEAAAFDGFSGKLAIHPAQVATINAAFTPSADQVAAAKAVIAAFAAAPSSGAVAVDGTMLDRPHVLAAERVLARAR